MAKKTGYVLDREMANAVQQVVRQHLASWQPQLVGRRRRRGGRGVVGTPSQMTLATASGAIPARVDNDTPGLGSVDVVKGSGSSSDWENWSTKTIPNLTFLIGDEIDGDMVIIQAFC